MEASLGVAFSLLLHGVLRMREGIPVGLNAICYRGMLSGVRIGLPEIYGTQRVFHWLYAGCQKALCVCIAQLVSLSVLAVMGVVERHLECTNSTKKGVLQAIVTLHRWYCVVVLLQYLFA